MPTPPASGRPASERRPATAAAAAATGAAPIVPACMTGQTGGYSLSGRSLTQRNTACSPAATSSRRIRQPLRTTPAMPRSDAPGVGQARVRAPAHGSSSTPSRCRRSTRKVAPRLQVDRRKQVLHQGDVLAADEVEVIGHAPAGEDVVQRAGVAGADAPHPQGTSDCPPSAPVPGWRRRHRTSPSTAHSPRGQRPGLTESKKLVPPRSARNRETDHPVGDSVMHGTYAALGTDCATSANQAGAAHDATDGSRDVGAPQQARDEASNTPASRVTLRDPRGPGCHVRPTTRA